VHALLRDGAHLLTTAQDLLQTMGWAPTPTEIVGGGDEELGPLFSIADQGLPPTTPSELLDRGILGRTPHSLDELVDRCELPPSKLLSFLTRLEMEGRIERSEEGWHTP
jgi:predicted Rossmann fold nucleotide-binding protein DprA/Smf involved in DNA uptake